MDIEGSFIGMIATIADITEKIQTANEKEKLVTGLQKAVDEINVLRGILPICSICKKIRDDEGAWHRIEEYISSHSEVKFSHGICKDCVRTHYPYFVPDGV